MKNETRTVRTLYYYSEIDTDFETTKEAESRLIALADENYPHVYKLLKGTTSQLFGRHSFEWLGWARGDTKSAAALMHRLESFFDQIQNVNAFYKWRAEFSLLNFEERGFRSGLFQQHAMWEDGKEYPRAAITIDFTPESLEESIDRFVDWMDPHFKNTTRITVDGDNVRVLGTIKDGSFTHVNRSSSKKEKGSNKRGLSSAVQKTVRE